jgi:hypothetical protein
MFLLYRDIFTNKIRYGSRILVDTDGENMTLNEDVISTRKLKIENGKTDGLYDFIILENITKHISDDNTVLNSILTSAKQMLKNNGIIMFINDICLTSNYVSDTFLYYASSLIGYNYRISYLSDIFVIIHENDLKVIDNYRLETKSTFLYTKDVFLISCINRF